MLSSLIVSTGHLVNNQSFPWINFQFAAAQEVSIGNYAWKAHEDKNVLRFNEYNKKKLLGKMVAALVSNKMVCREIWLKVNKQTCRSVRKRKLLYKHQCRYVRKTPSNDPKQCPSVYPNQGKRKRTVSIIIILPIPATTTSAFRIVPLFRTTSFT